LNAKKLLKGKEKKNAGIYRLHNVENWLYQVVAPKKARPGDRRAAHSDR